MEILTFTTQESGCGGRGGPLIKDFGKQPVCSRCSPILIQYNYGAARAWLGGPGSSLVIGAFRGLARLRASLAEDVVPSGAPSRCPGPRTLCLDGLGPEAARRSHLRCFKPPWKKGQSDGEWIGRYAVCGGWKHSHRLFLKPSRDRQLSTQPPQALQ